MESLLILPLSNACADCIPDYDLMAAMRLLAWETFCTGRPIRSPAGSGAESASIPAAASSGVPPTVPAWNRPVSLCIVN
jgi:hypothetical protein